MATFINTSSLWILFIITFVSTAPTPHNPSTVPKLQGNVEKLHVCRNGEKMADASDCTGFYQCICKWNSLQIEWHYCPKGHVYDKKSSRCNKNADKEKTCHPNILTLILRQNIMVAPQISGPCEEIPEYCEDGTKWAEPDDCTVYWECSNDNIYQRSCPIGTAFDKNNKSCVHEDDAVCQGPCDATSTSTLATTMAPIVSTTMNSYNSSVSMARSSMSSTAFATNIMDDFFNTTLAVTDSTDSS